MTHLSIIEDAPLAPLTTLGLGGPAKHLVRVQRPPEILAALRWADDEGLPAAVLAGGSNLIVPDEGYPGLVIHLHAGDVVVATDGRIRADAGVPWERVVEESVGRGWAGAECLSGIPGSVGAAPMQNVGAYGQEVAEIVEDVQVIRRDTHEMQELDPTECDFGYRDSLFKREPGRFIVTSVRFRFRPEGAPTLRYGELVAASSPNASLSDVRAQVLGLRRAKSMVLDPHDPNRRSAGSFFVNPVMSRREADRIVERCVAENLVADPAEVPRYEAPNDEVKLAAGWLIERAGITKGMRRGPVGISTKHALALVHHGGGTTADLLALADEVRDRVFDRFGVRLEREPRLLG